jgi:hypothetical protein
MGRLRWLVIVLCLLPATCSGVRGRPGPAACDYLDFIRLGGVIASAIGPGMGTPPFWLRGRLSMRRMFFPETGELMPGVYAPQEFSNAVVSALNARQRTCGQEP